MSMKVNVSTVRCSKCQAEWAPRISNPIRCPRCGNKIDGKPKRDYEYAPWMPCHAKGCQQPAMARKGGLCPVHQKAARKGKAARR